MLFGSSVAETAADTGTPERTMYRRIEPFEKDGMLSALDDAEWLKVLKLEGYAPRRVPGPMALHEVLVPCLDIL